MDNNKKNLIIATIGLVFGIGFVVNGIINIKQLNEKNKPDTPSVENNENNNIEEPVKESDVETWLNGNTEVVDYLINYAELFDDTNATVKDYSNALAWYLLNRESEKETSKNKDYDYDLVIPQEVALTFMQNTFNKGLDIVNFEDVTLSKENLNFLTEGNSYRIQVKETEFKPNTKSILDNINIISNNEIEVTYGLTEEDATCEPVTKDCYIKYRKLTLSKKNDVFNILKTTDEEIETSENPE